MSFISKTFRYLTSDSFFLHLLVTVLFWNACLIYFLKLGLWEALGLMPSKIFVVMLFVNRAVDVSLCLFTRKRTVVLSAGMLTVISALLVNYAFRFEGVASLGVGEFLPGFDYAERGIRGVPGQLSLVAGKIEGDMLKLDKEGSVELLGERERHATLKVGEYTEWSHGRTVELLGIGPAPRYVIADKLGKQIHSSYVKLRLYPQGVIDYFRVEELPYRFYVTLTDKPAKPFNLKILRGKLLLFNKDIAVGEEAGFEGLKISFPEVSRWAEIRVRYYPGNVAIYAGLVLAALGAFYLAVTSAGTHDARSA